MASLLRQPDLVSCWLAFVDVVEKNEERGASGRFAEDGHGFRLPCHLSHFFLLLIPHFDPTGRKRPEMPKGWVGFQLLDPVEIIADVLLQGWPREDEKAAIDWQRG